MSYLSDPCVCGHPRIGHVARKGGGPCEKPSCPCRRYRDCRPTLAEVEAVLAGLDGIASLVPEAADAAALLRRLPARTWAWVKPEAR